MLCVPFCVETIVLPASVLGGNVSCYLGMNPFISVCLLADEDGEIFV